MINIPHVPGPVVVVVFIVLFVAAMWFLHVWAGDNDE